MNYKRLIKLLIIFIALFGIRLTPVPNGLDAEIWGFVGVYIALLLGLILKPFPEPIITLIVIGIAATFNDANTLLSGYGNSMPWFIVTVTIVCTAFIKTGLGKRIAYNLLRKTGNSTINLGYTMLFTDLILSPATGSNSSRTTIIYPIFQSIAEATGSSANKNPRKLGSYLTILMYIISMGTSALFLTGMATNAITVQLINEMLGISITWGKWLLASIVPIGIFLLMAPFVVYKIYPPELKNLEEIKPIAEKNLKEMGPITSVEKKLLFLFALAILGWMFGPKLQFINLSMQIVGLLFLSLTLLFGVLNWNDVMDAKGAWNIFIWYGAFYGVANILAKGGFYEWFSSILGGVLNLGNVNGFLVTLLLAILSLAVRYFFVSNSAFVASFYPVLFTLALKTQANPMILALLLAFLSPIGALLTHYGNGAGLITFGSGYVGQKEFWTVGTIMVIIEFIILIAIGLPYWKLVGLI